MEYRTGPNYAAKGLFGNWLADNMVRSKLTQADLVKIIGSNRSSISRYISKNRFPKYLTVVKLCEIFHDDPNIVYNMVLSDRYPDVAERWSACVH